MPNVNRDKIKQTNELDYKKKKSIGLGLSQTQPQKSVHWERIAQTFIISTLATSIVNVECQ